MKTISFLALVIFLFSSCNKNCFEDNACKLKGEEGGCSALINGYYFDKKQKKCVEFIWGGCDGVRPFETMEACQNSCECVD